MGAGHPPSGTNVNGELGGPGFAIVDTVVKDVFVELYFTALTVMAMAPAKPRVTLVPCLPRDVSGGLHRVVTR